MRLFSIEKNKLFLVKDGNGRLSSGPIVVDLSLKDFKVLGESASGQMIGAWVSNKDGFFYITNKYSGLTIKKIKHKINSLTALDCDFAVTDSGVLGMHLPLPNADPATFKLVENSPCFAYDKNQVYASSNMKEGTQVWDEVDISSVIFLDQHVTGNRFLFVDKNHLYQFNQHFIYYENYSGVKMHYPVPTWQLTAKGEFVDNPDYSEEEEKKFMETQGTLKKYLQFHYPHIGDAWWNLGKDYYRKLKELRWLRNIYLKDEKVFFKLNRGTTILKNELVLNEISYRLSPGSKIEKRPFFCVIPSADVNSFESLNKFYSKDAKRVYHYMRWIKEADPENFKALEGHFAKDKNHVFYRGYICKGADPESFAPVGPEGGKDKNHSYAIKKSARIGPFKGYDELLQKVTR